MRYLDKSSAEILKQKWPTFLDMTGFQNSDSEFLRKTMDSIMDGRIKNGAKLNTLSRDKRDWLDFLEQFYCGDELVAKVDRIIFVSSARSKNPPCELIDVLISLAMGGKRDIPIFGVLTHADKKEDIDPEFEKKFKSFLGLNNQRFLLCSNYCDDIPSQGERVPKVEVPIAKFLKQVMDPAREVFQEKPDFIENVRRHLNMQLKVPLEKTLFLLFSFLFFTNMATEKYLWVLFLLVLSKVCTECFLQLFLSFWPDLNDRIWSNAREM